MEIIASSIEEMTEIVAGLVKQGLTFTAFKQDNDRWLIKMTGGF